MNELFRSNSFEHQKDATSPDRKYSIDALHCRTVNTSWGPLTPNNQYQYRCNLQVEAFLYNVCSFPSVCQTVPNWVSHDSLLNDMFLTTTKQVLRLEKDTRKSFTEICKVKLDTCYVNTFVKLQCNWQDMWHSFRGEAEQSQSRGSTDALSQSQINISLYLIWSPSVQPHWKWPSSALALLHWCRGTRENDQALRSVRKLA